VLHGRVFFSAAKADLETRMRVESFGARLVHLRALEGIIAPLQRTALSCSSFISREVPGRSLSARVSRGFHLACADLKPARAFVVHAGDDRYPMSESLEAVSVRGLAAELRARS